MNSEKDNYEIYDLLILLLEDDLRDSQREHLVKWSKTDPDAAEKYADFISYYSLISNELTSRFGYDLGSSFDSQFDRALCEAVNSDSQADMDSNVSLKGVDMKDALSDKKEGAFAGYELSQDDSFSQALLEAAEFARTAPEVIIDKPIKEPDEPEGPPVIKPARLDQKMSRFSAYTLAFSAAAMLLFAIFLSLVPEAPPHVAYLGDTVNAVWGESTEEKGIGEELRAGAYYLEKGLVQILFYNGAKVVLEGPADFKLISTSSMELISGKVVANVNRGAAGFVVNTPSAKVLDLGTEFAVDVDLSGNSDIHVFDGEVVLYPENSEKKMALLKGKAKNISTSGQEKDIKLNRTAFVRQAEFNSNVKAQQGDSYNRWLAYSYQLRRDRSLVAYYTFEKDGQSPDILRNKASLTEDMLDGDLYSAIDGKLPTWTAGRWPQKTALTFDRSQRQVVVVPSDPALHINGPITITAWVRCPNPDDGGHIVSCRLPDHGTANYQFGYKSPVGSVWKDKIQFGRMLKHGATEDRVHSRQNFDNFAEWKFIAATHDSKGVRFYVDGKLIETHKFEFLQESVIAGLIIGADNLASDPSRFTGDMGELAIFKRVLTVAEIDAMYKAGRP